MRVFLNKITVNLLMGTMVFTTILTSFIWITQLVRYLALVTEFNTSVKEMFLTTALLVPDFITVILPSSFALAVICIYEKLRMSNQLTAAFYSGVNLWKMAQPILTNALFFASMLLIINFFISPKFIHEFKTYQFDAMQRITFKDKNSIVNYGGLSFFVKERLDENNIKGIVVCSTGKDSSYAMLAEEGEIINDKRNKNLQINLMKGARSDYTGESPIEVSFDKYSTDLKYSKKTGEKKSYEKFIIELLTSGHKNDVVEAHKRIVAPLLIIIYPLIVFIFLIKLNSNRRLNIKGIVLSILCIASMQGVQILLFNLSQKWIEVVMLIYILNLSFIVLLYRILHSEK